MKQKRSPSGASFFVWIERRAQQYPARIAWNGADAVPIDVGMEGSLLLPAQSLSETGGKKAGGIDGLVQGIARRPDLHQQRPAA